VAFGGPLPESRPGKVVSETVRPAAAPGSSVSRRRGHRGGRGV